MSDKTVTIYDERLASGLYMSITQDIRNLGTAFLGAASFNQHFVLVAPKWPPHFSYKLKNADASKDYHCVVFGEIAPGTLGTVLHAAGNHIFEGPDNTLVHITDDSKTRDILALQCPKQAPPSLCTMFNNQLATLGEIHSFDEEEEKKAQKTTYVKDFVRSSNPDTSDPVADIFLVHLPVKYQKPGGLNVSTGIKRFEKQVVHDNDHIEDNASLPPLVPTSTASGTDFHVPTNEEIYVGAYYDPRLLYDHRGPAFKLINNKLVQHDMRDLENNLITPWSAYEELRPGTVVLIEATIHCFRFNINGRRERKVYQLHAERLNVLAKSDSVVELRTPPLIPSHLQPTSPSPSLSNEFLEDATEAFANFRKRKATCSSNCASPTKTAKTDETNIKIESAKKPANETNLVPVNKIRRPGRKAGNHGEIMECDD